MLILHAFLAMTSDFRIDLTLQNRAQDVYLAPSNLQQGNNSTALETPPSKHS